MTKIQNSKLIYLKSQKSKLPKQFASQITRAKQNSKYPPPP